MCTAISHLGKSHYFGRNLDLEYTFTEQVVVTPRNYPFHFRSGAVMHHHFAMIGMATVSDNYPLYYEATNECGLSIAALNFPGNAVYLPKAANRDNIAPFELIPWILCQCKNVVEARNLLKSVNIWHLPFSRAYPLSPLHWMVSDKDSSIVVEPIADGLHVYENPLGVLTNNPPFPYHLQHISNYMHLQPSEPTIHFAAKTAKYYSNGMGAIGLPGDFSSASRFIRAAFIKENSISKEDDIAQFFHILGSVAMPRGSVKIKGKDEITQYSCCCDTHKGIYYYASYSNRRIQAVHMRNCPLLCNQLFCYPLHTENDIRYLN